MPQLMAARFLQMRWPRQIHILGGQSAAAWLSARPFGLQYQRRVLSGRSPFGAGTGIRRALLLCGPLL